MGAWLSKNLFNFSKKNLPMIKISSTYFQKLLTRVFLITVILLISVNTVYSNDRKLIGIDLFPSFLASDQNIRSKVGEDNLLHVVIAYQYDKKTANDMANRLKNLEKIRGIPIKVNMLSVDDIEYSEDQSIAGIFIAEPMLPLVSIIKKSIDNHFIVFSPFEGDVEKGVTGGIYITEKIVPYINSKTLVLAEIKMKAFFLRVSKKYE
jgi:hypothetical protein